MTLKWFHKDGREFTGTLQTVSKSRTAATYLYLDQCNRCGGAGRSDKWIRTGKVCFKCGGAGNFGHKTGHLVTEEKAKELLAKKAAKEAIKQAERQAETDKRRAALLATKNAFLANEDNARLIDSLNLHASNSFYSSLLDGFNSFGYLTDNQIVVAKASLEKLSNKVNEHVGAKGDKLTDLTLKVTVVSISQGDWGDKSFIAFEDSQGRAFIWSATGATSLERGNEVVLKGTVKDHKEYRNIKQTVLTRCKYEKKVSEEKQSEA